MGAASSPAAGRGGLWAILASVPHLHDGVVLQLGAPSAALGPSPRGVRLCPEEPSTQPLCGCRDLLMYLSPPSCLHTDRPFSRGPSDRWADHCPITPHPYCPGASSPTNSPSLIYSSGVFSLRSGGLQCVHFRWNALKALHRTTRPGPSPALCPQKPASARQSHAHGTRRGPLGTWASTAHGSPALSRTHAHTHPHTPADSDTHTHFRTLTFTHMLTQSHTLSSTLSHTHPSDALTLLYSLLHTHSLSYTPTVVVTHSSSDVHTHTLTFIHSPAPTFTHFLTHTHTLT